MGRPSLLSVARDAMYDSLPSVRGDAARDGGSARHAVSNPSSARRVASAARSPAGPYDATSGRGTPGRPTDDPLRLGGRASLRPGGRAGGR